MAYAWYDPRYTVGKAIDVWGKALGSPLPELGISEKLMGLVASPVKAAEPQPTQAISSQMPTSYWSSQMPTGGTTLTGTTTYQPTTMTTTGEEPAPSGPSPEEIYRSQLTGQVESMYSDIFAGLDKLAGMLPGWKEEKTKLISDLYGTQTGEIETGQEAALGRLGEYRGEIRTEQAQNLKALAEQLRNWARAGQIQLGAWGAGASSAVPMYQYALAKEAGKRSTDIARQVSSMFNDLRMKEEDIRLAFTQSKSQLETWKTEQLGAVADWYQSKIEGIEQQKIGATAEKAAALAEAERLLLSDAYNRLRTIQGQVTEWDNAMREWAINRMASIDDYKIQLGQLSQYSPQQIAWQELQGMGALPQAGAEQPWYNPYAAKLKKEEEQFAQTWG